MAKAAGMNRFVIFVIGVLVGLGLAVISLGIVTFGPNPFETGKVTLGTANVDPSKALQGGVDPNQRLNEIEGLTVPTAKTAEGRPEVTPVKTEAASTGFWIQAGAFMKEDGAQERAVALAFNGYQTQVIERNKRFIVIAGPFIDRIAAIEAIDTLKQQGIEAQETTKP